MYAVVGGNGEACDTDTADNKDGEGTVNKVDGKPAAAVAAAAAVDKEGTVDEVQEVEGEEGQPGAVGYQDQMLEDIVDRDLEILGAS